MIRQGFSAINMWMGDCDIRFSAVSVNCSIAAGELKIMKKFAIVFQRFFLLLLAVVVGGCGGGGGGGTSKPPVADHSPSLTMTVPVSGEELSETRFCDDEIDYFYIQFTYTGVAAMNISTLSVTVEVDDNEQDISSYFSASSATKIKSGDIINATQTLINCHGGLDEKKTVTVKTSISDMAGNSGSNTATFKVIPAAPPPGPG
jgi:hypothetical protein